MKARNLLLALTSKALCTTFIYLFIIAHEGRPNRLQRFSDWENSYPQWTGESSKCCGSRVGGRNAAWREYVADSARGSTCKCVSLIYQRNNCRRYKWTALIDVRHVRLASSVRQVLVVSSWHAYVSQYYALNCLASHCLALNLAVHVITTSCLSTHCDSVLIHCIG